MDTPRFCRVIKFELYHMNHMFFKHFLVVVKKFYIFEKSGFTFFTSYIIIGMLYQFDPEGREPFEYKKKAASWHLY